MKRKAFKCISGLVTTPISYLTLADAPPLEVLTRSLAQWTLYGVDQPGVSDDDSDA
ncbi:hypothetical protein [Mycobacterium spongiae]|uniref:Uncharacterized protein n=1 Tax=Mycobacterium spongiae TaxID=886343 RepID=A0A975JZT3_9MYCO|nr:hypothetical protein [Mycobacterium spongiae]QUR68745.1 hypothetical protein F6B93_18185 [Mycobacterium spongiae]